MRPCRGPGISLRSRLKETEETRALGTVWSHHFFLGYTLGPHDWRDREGKQVRRSMAARLSQTQQPQGST